MHHALGVLALLGLVAFAFGERAARTLVQIVLIAGALGFAYIMWRIVEGTI